MVSVILRGGLGNQLFQYATGRAHSIRTGSALSAYTSRLNLNHGPNVEKRPLHLIPFDLPVEYIGNTTTYMPNWELFERIPRIVASISQPLAMLLFNKYIEDRTLIFDQHVLELPGDVTLDGYWQSERYFMEFTDKLRREIIVADSIRGENLQWYKRINSSNSVSVHVRRGDYVTLGWALPPEYYRNAIAQLNCIAHISDIFFFSDDMEWVRSHCEKLLPDYRDYDVHYVECNDGESAHEDLRLMRACDHHVIANSSLSWWGAWLDDSDSKKVVAPKYWVHDWVDGLDIVPNRWSTADW